MLDASPTLPTRLHNASYEVFLSRATHFENDSGIGQLAVRLTGEIKNILVSHPQDKFTAKFHQQADGIQNCD